MDLKAVGSCGRRGCDMWSQMSLAPSRFYHSHIPPTHVLILHFLGAWWPSRLHTKRIIFGIPLCICRTQGKCRVHHPRRVTSPIEIVTWPCKVITTVPTSIGERGNWALGPYVVTDGIAVPASSVDLALKVFGAHLEDCEDLEDL